MPLNKPRTVFGAHSMSAENRTTGIPYGIIKTIAEASAQMKRDSIDLFAGSNPIAWDSMDGKMSSELTLTIKEFKPFLYDLAGYTKTTMASHTTGKIVGTTTGTTAILPSPKYSAATNTFDGTNGVTIAITSGSVADLKDGKYVLVATAAQAFDIYCLTDVYFGEGQSVTYTNDALKIGSISGALSTASALAKYGIEFTKAGTTLALAAGDTATFEILAPHLESYEYSLGDKPSPIEFGMYLYSQKKGTDEYVVDYFPRVILSGIPAGIKENEWINLPLTAKILYDETLGYSYKRKDLVRANS